MQINRFQDNDEIRHLIQRFTSSVTDFSRRDTIMPLLAGLTCAHFLPATTLLNQTVLRKNAMNDEDRLIDIELKLTYQEDTVDTLNKIVYQQQRKIDELEKLLSALARQLKENTGSNNERTIADEKPPHY